MDQVLHARARLEVLNQAAKPIQILAVLASPPTLEQAALSECSLQKTLLRSQLRDRFG